MIGVDEAPEFGIVIARHLSVSAGVDWLIRVAKCSMEFQRCARIDADVFNGQQLGARRSAFTLDAKQFTRFIVLSDDAVHLREFHPTVPVRNR